MADDNTELEAKQELTSPQSKPASVATMTRKIPSPTKIKPSLIDILQEEESMERKLDYLDFIHDTTKPEWAIRSKAFDNIKHHLMDTDFDADDTKTMLTKVFPSMLKGLTDPHFKVLQNVLECWTSIVSASSAHASPFYEQIFPLVIGLQNDPQLKSKAELKKSCTSLLDTFVSFFEPQKLLEILFGILNNSEFNSNVRIRHGTVNMIAANVAKGKQEYFTKLPSKCPSIFSNDLLVFRSAFARLSGSFHDGDKVVKQNIQMVFIAMHSVNPTLFFDGFVYQGLSDRQFIRDLVSNKIKDFVKLEELAQNAKRRQKLAKSQDPIASTASSSSIPRASSSTATKTVKPSVTTKLPVPKKPIASKSSLPYPAPAAKTTTKPSIAVKTTKGPVKSAIPKPKEVGKKSSNVTKRASELISKPRMEVKEENNEEKEKKEYTEQKNEMMVSGDGQCEELPGNIDEKTSVVVDAEVTKETELAENEEVPVDESAVVFVDPEVESDAELVENVSVSATGVHDIGNAVDDNEAHEADMNAVNEEEVRPNASLEALVETVSAKNTEVHDQNASNVDAAIAKDTLDEDNHAGDDKEPTLCGGFPLENDGRENLSIAPIDEQDTISLNFDDGIDALAEQIVDEVLLQAIADAKESQNNEQVFELSNVAKTSEHLPVEIEHGLLEEVIPQLVKEEVANVMKTDFRIIAQAIVDKMILDATDKSLESAAQKEQQEQLNLFSCYEHAEELVDDVLQNVLETAHTQPYTQDVNDSFDLADESFADFVTANNSAILESFREPSADMSIMLITDEELESALCFKQSQIEEKPDLRYVTESLLTDLIMNALSQNSV